MVSGQTEQIGRGQFTDIVAAKGDLVDGARESGFEHAVVAQAECTAKALDLPPLQL
jgi:hypothetical protein